MAADCKVVTIPPGNSFRKRSFKRKLCWAKKGIKSNCDKNATSAACSGRGPRRRKSSGGRRRTPGGAKNVRRTTVSRNTAKTLVAKASYAYTKSGKLRKGCRKVSGVLRCQKRGAARG